MSNAESPQLLVFTSPEPKNGFLYGEFWDRVVKAVPDSVKLAKNVFMVSNHEKRNRAQDEFISFLLETEGVEYFSVRIAPPVVGSFSAEKEGCFDQCGLEPNNMRLSGTRQGH